MRSPNFITESGQGQFYNDHASQTSSMKRSSSMDSKSSNSGGRYCVCSPTKHAGSFRCRLHRGSLDQQHHELTPETTHTKPSASPAAVEAKKPMVGRDNIRSPDFIIESSQGHVYNDHVSQSSSMKRSSSMDSKSSKSGGSYCVCSPRNHTGSFHCRLHRGSLNHQYHDPTPAASHTKLSASASPAAAVEAK